MIVSLLLLQPVQNFLKNVWLKFKLVDSEIYLMTGKNLGLNLRVFFKVQVLVKKVTHILKVNV